MPVEAFFERLCSATTTTATDAELSKRGKNKPGLLKLRDWPGEDDFKARAPRHAEAFFSSLPFQEYTNAEDGPLNLSVALPKEGGAARPGADETAPWGAPPSARLGDAVAAAPPGRVGRGERAPARRARGAGRRRRG